MAEPPPIVVSESEHVLDIHPNHGIPGAPPSFSVGTLCRLIEWAEPTLAPEVAEDAQAGKGKKRALQTKETPHKRRKVEIEESLERNNESRRAILQHTFRIIRGKESGYRLSQLSEDDLGRIETLAAKWFDENPDQPLRLGAPILGAPHRDSSYLYSQCESGSHDILLSLPDISPPVDLEAFDFNIRSQNLLVACSALQDAGKVAADCSLSLGPLPEDRKETSSLPFVFIVEIRISVIFPSILEPIYHVNNSTSTLGELQRRLLIQIFPPLQHPVVSDIPFFYESLQQAPAIPSLRIERCAQPPKLLPNLLPFQRRTTHKLLKLEGKGFDSKGRLASVPAETPKFDPTDATWQTVHLPATSDSGSADGDVWYINRLTGSLSINKPPQREESVGCLLAEEMGLGKTLECLALIMLNPYPNRSPSTKRWDPEGIINVSEIKSTLIVTPPSLLSQWMEEIKRHAPSIRVFHYEGWAKANKIKMDKVGAKQKKSRKRKRDEDGEDEEEEKVEKKELPAEEAIPWADLVNAYDIVLTTFNVLQSDLAVARAPIARPRRATVLDSYSNDRKEIRSPLVTVEWARVIMDEVQLFGGRAAEMMGLIPRLHSLAVSGTPAKGSVGDLIQMLRFLKVGDEITANRHWKRLLQPGFSDVIRNLFGELSVRTMKSSVQDELTIPPQRRYVVGVDMGKVERHVYDESMRQALDELGIDADGVIQGELNIPLLRAWLRKLRAVATHPQVGMLGDRGRILGEEGHLKTIANVLQDMQVATQREIMDAQKAKILASIRKAQLLQLNQKNARRNQDSLDVLFDCRHQADQMAETIHAYIQEVKDEAGRLLSQESGTASRVMSADVDASSSTEHDDQEGRFPKAKIGEDLRSRHQALQSRLRECQITRHKIIFLTGNIYNVLGKAKEEAATYEEADSLRKQLLKSTERGALRAMQILEADSLRKKYDPELEMEIQDSKEHGNKNIKTLLREANKSNILLTAQRDLLLVWRQEIIDRLTQPLSGKEGSEDADGQEYARALDTQGEVEQYMQAYTALLADRREAYKAERTALAAHENKVTKLRQTKAAAKAMAIDVGPDDLIPLESKAEHEVLRAELTAKRTSLRGADNYKALKSIMVSLNTLASGLLKKSADRALALEEVARLRKVVKDQETAAEHVENELTHFRKAFNERVLYFKQLQLLSDSVADIELEVPWDEDLRSTELDIEEDERIEDKKRQHLGYLNSLAAENDDDDDDEGCIICTEVYESGWIFECAHRCCERCLGLLYKKRQSCPICRKVIDFANVQRVVTDKQLPSTSNSQEEGMGVDPSQEHTKLTEVEYNRIPIASWKEIQEVEVAGSYGDKIGSLVKHLVWLQENDPGTKSIVFSAWADSLAIIEHALKSNGIPCLQIKAVKGKRDTASEFKSNPNIFVFLLHGERENAGLNLTEAKRVFCLEPVVNHAFETQAIARIDRMGQDSETEVYCYYSEDTVERNILDLGARQGVSLYTRDHATGTLLNTSTSDHQSRTKQIDSLKKGAGRGKGDFVHSADDMVAILFPQLSYEGIQDNDHDMAEKIEMEAAEEYALRENAAKAGLNGGEPIASTSAISCR